MRRPSPRVVFTHHLTGAFLTSGPIGQLQRTLGDQYRIEREIGSGGMATVYVATDVKHGRQVAVKVVRPELGLVGPDRFLREIRVAAQLNHPNILALHDSGEADGILYYVMPLVRGESLRQRLTRERQLPVGDAVGIVRQVALALDYAHNHGVVHRDIKPENILIHEGVPLVADFGIALAVAAASAQRLTETGLALGTPAYMSPEQAFGDEELDGRSDIYSLACVLFELLAGEPPFIGPTAMSIITKRMTDPVPSVRRLREGVPAGIEQALSKALAKSRADRFPTASAFGEALLVEPAARQGHPVVAVLPFRNLGGDADNECFADGITEDVIVHLSKLRTLDVISRASVMPFKQRTHGIREIATALKAGSILDGSVRRAGNRVRITAQLIDAQSEQHLWAETYDRDLTDIFAIQTDVALQLATALQAELTTDERTRIRREPTSDLQAYELYLKGRASHVRYTKTGYMAGIALYEDAVAKDARFARAHAAIAMSWTEMGETGLAESARAYSIALAAATRALELDPTLADAHAVMGHLKYVSEFDWVGAERSLQRALALQPGHADAHDLYGRLCGAQGRFDEAIVMLRRAKALDPIPPHSDLANALLRAGRVEEALEQARDVVRQHPEYDRGHAVFGWALMHRGMTDAGLASLQEAMRLSPDNVQWLAQFGEALGLAGRHDEARAVLARLTAMSASQYVSPYLFAYVHTGLGEPDIAMDWLERAFAERAGAVYGIKGSFLFASLREHPRFLALLQKLQLTTPVPMAS